MTKVSQASGSISLSLQDSMSVYMTAARLSPVSDPAKRKFFLPSAITRSFCPCRARSRGLLLLASPLWSPCSAAIQRAARRRPRCPRRGGARLIVVLATWMLDPAACSGMKIGAPRADVAALSDLHRLLVERGFRRSSLGDPRIAKEEQNEQFAEVGSDNAGAVRGPAPAQHRIRFHPAAGHERLRACESDRVSGKPLDASGGCCDGGATMTNADLLPAAVLKRKAVVY
jgi:hypothetical protein